MIYARTGHTFEATLDNAPTGLTGTLGVAIYDTPADEDPIVARTTAGIAESPAGSGLYAVTLTAPDDSGTYSVVWDDGDGNYAREDLIVSSTWEPVTATDITPTLDEVGALIKARTRDDDGNELGTFTDDTRPTGDEVTDFVTFAVSEVTLRIPASGDLPDALIAYARRLVAIRAAMSVELSFDPDRTGDDTAYARLKEWYDTGMAGLMAFADTERVDDTPTGPFVA